LGVENSLKINEELLVYMVYTIYLYYMNNETNTETTTKLAQTTEGQLVRFSNKSDVYKVLSVNTSFTTLFNMYTEKEVAFKNYVNKRGAMFQRTVEVVDFY